ncbi:MAG: hypothetical protein ACK46L_16685 [Synechococcaceae cyanobacterium]
MLAPLSIARPLVPLALPPWLTAVLLLLMVLVGPVRAGENLRVPLECRLGQGPWLPCAMEVRKIGEDWQLVIGGRRIGFRHDQRGSLRMRKPGSDWRLVDSRWIEDSSLCWDGVCARGDIPLD